MILVDSMALARIPDDRAVREFRLPGSLQMFLKQYKSSIWHPKSSLQATTPLSNPVSATENPLYGNPNPLSRPRILYPKLVATPV